MPTGRPTIYTPELAEAICMKLAEGRSLRAVCSAPEMPNRDTVSSWVINDVQGFSGQYAKARDIALDMLADEVLEIADTTQLGVKTKTDDTGKSETTEGDMIEHRRLRVDARKWYLSKLAPKRYGDKVINEHTGSVEIKHVVREIIDHAED